VKTRVVEIADSGAIVHDVGGKYHMVQVENVILEVDLKPMLWPGVKNALNDGQIEIYGIGNCGRTWTIFDAIHEGHLAARHL
jgi:hypothetical protein